MTKSFQKSANILQELQPSHPGIINSEDFNKYFELHCYKPSLDLQPFVTHIWTQRAKQPIDHLYKPPIEILSGPNVYLFFTPESAFIHSPTGHKFGYDPSVPGVIAGVKFQAGGFYSFSQELASRLNVTVPPITSVFPKANAAFKDTLLVQSDKIIVAMIESLLRDRSPQSSKGLSLVTEILAALTANSSLRTVSATAQAFRMSERSLQLLFQTHVGVGVKWIIARRRLLEAIERAQSQQSSTWVEIAAELGYSSQSHFSRDFKKITGIAPSEYLKSLRQQPHERVTETHD